MSRRATAHRASRQLLLAVVGLLLVSSLLPAGPAAAHVFTKLDGDDSPGKLDLRSAAVSHTSTSVVHRISTYNAWTPRSLGNDSFFVIQIDKNNDRNYERCAFIFYTNRLRGSLSNCGARFIRYLPVAKLSGTAARVTIPKSELGGVYWWGAVSLWDGPRPCARGCVDFAPNRFPDILHDLTRPVITMNTDPLGVWNDATTPDFVFPFSVSDTHTRVDWSIQNRLLGTTTWTTVSTGSSEGLQEPSFTGVAAGQYEYRVIAVDRQGNRTIGSILPVSVPTDVDADMGPGVSVGGVDTDDIAAYGGSYVALDDLDDTYAISYDHPGGPCRDFIVIGPGSGDWTVQVSDGTDPIFAIQSSGITDAPRQFLYGESICGDATRIFTFIGGTDGSAGFGIDALVL